jgi:ABC-type Mn2+/Zn2+ transport system permease subunit
MDREMAQVVGLRVGWWATVFAMWLGTVIGFSIHVAGVIYAFASLVLPALIAKNLSREVRSMFFLSPLVALISGIFSFMLANYYDYPPGQMASASLCFVLAVAWFVHYLRTTRLPS